MKRTITIEADDYDLPVNLQAVQKTAATWNGQAVELTLKELGFDGVDAGGLDESWRQQPGTPVYTKDFDADGVRRALYSPVRNTRPRAESAAQQGWDSRRSDDFSADTSGGNSEQDSHTTYQQDAE
jgi:hypothetical protein